MPHDAINTALEQIQKRTGNLEAGPNLEEIARQRRDTPYYEYLQSQFAGVYRGMLDLMRGGVWANNGDPKQEAEFIRLNQEARQSIYRHAMERVRLSEQLMVQQNVPNRDQLRDQL